MECFSEPVRITVFAGRGVRGILTILFENCDSFVWGHRGFEGPPCVSVVSRCVQHALLGHRSSRHMCSNRLLREKETVLLSRGGKGIWSGVSFWRSEAHFFFRHTRVAFPVRGPLRDCYFCIYLFYFVFISLNFFLCYFFFYVMYFFYFLFPPPASLE